LLLLISILKETLMRARLSLIAGLVVSGFSALAIIASDVESAPRAKSAQRDFVISDGEGYGTRDCLSQQGQCGRIVADAWCESKGFKKALAYRQLDRDEITGSVPPKPNMRPVDSFLISCQD
jgi:hypothetical protein